MVYADWLQDQGDPRGELIVLQYRTPRTKAQLARETALLEEYGEQWQGRLGELTTWAEFDRGFLARCGLRTIPRWAIGRRAWSTVEHIGIADDWNRDIVPLVTHAMMKSLRSLRLPNRAFATMLEGDAKSPVERVVLDGSLDDRELRALTTASMFDCVVSLDIKGNVTTRRTLFEPLIYNRFELITFTSGGWTFTCKRGEDGRLSAVSVSAAKPLRGTPITLAPVMEFFISVPFDALTAVELSLPTDRVDGIRDLKRLIKRQRRLVYAPSL